MDTLGDRVRAERIARGWTQSELAKRIVRAGYPKMSQAGVAQIEKRGDTEPKCIVQLAQALGVAVRWLQTGRGDRLSDGLTASPDAETSAPAPAKVEPDFQRPATNATIALDARPNVPLPSAMTRDLPVLGTSAGGSSGDFTMNGEVVDLVPRPPALAHRKDVFCCWVDGTSMVPWRRPREPVLVETKRRPLPGDHVVIELKPEKEGDPRPCYVKQLVRRTAAKLIVKQYNPDKEIEFPVSHVLNVYRVMEWHEILMPFTAI